MKKYFSIILLLGVAVLFTFGLVELFELRFERGDVYPPYSSLRADPLGAMAFYESLEKVPGISVRRDVADSDQLPDTPHTVYLQFSGSPYDWDWLPTETFRTVEDFLARGDRLVITFRPQLESYSWRDHDETETNSADSPAPKAKSEKMSPRKPFKKKHAPNNEDAGVDLNERWGFDTSFKKLSPVDETYAAVRVENKTDLPLPPQLDWHSGLVFTNLASAWRVIYARGTNAVVIERKFDKGTVVLATDSYFVSNEALEKDRHADLLAWLIGADNNVVVDESHFGIVETSGVAVLMRQYRLHGLAAGLLLLAGLFIWKNSTTLVPPPADEAAADFIAGKDAASGFVNLLRRSILPRDLLATCFAEWKKSVPSKNASSRFQAAEAIFQAEDSLPNKDRNLVAAYKKISNAINHHKL